MLDTQLPASTPGVGRKLTQALDGISQRAQDLQEDAADSTDAMQEQLSTAWGRVRKLERRATARARRGAAGADRFVRNRPWPVIVAVGVLGLAVGSMLWRRRH